MSPPRCLQRTERRGDEQAGCCDAGFRSLPRGLALVRPPPPRATEARAAEEQPGLPPPRARAAATLPWQPGRPALYACASVLRRLRAQPRLGDSGCGQVLQPDVSGRACLGREKRSGWRPHTPQFLEGRGAGVGHPRPVLAKSAA